MSIFCPHPNLTHMHTHMRGYALGTHTETMFFEINLFCQKLIIGSNLRFPIQETSFTQYNIQLQDCKYVKEYLLI